MTTEELKRDIHQLVDSVQNEGTLVDVYAAISLLIDQQDVPLADGDPVLRERMRKVMGQIERGEFVTNEAMKRQVQAWLAK